jgi:SRSO17 transposase
LGSIGKIDKGIVSVNAYGIYENLTFPLLFKVFQPKGTLKQEDKYQTKIEIAAEIISELVSFGFEIELVLVDSLYWESGLFIQTLNKFKLPWVLAIRSNHGVLMPSNQKVRANKWCKFERIFSNHTTETRYVREILFGKRRTKTYWEITTNPETMPKNSPSFVMTNIANKASQIKKVIGNFYGLRTWIEYGFRQCKQELGWTDYRLTKFEQIEKWWEIIMSAYWMISSYSKVFYSPKQSETVSNFNTLSKEIITDFTLHQQWSTQGGWKTTLNNLRLVIQPLLLLLLIVPWLDIFPNRHLLLGFHQLIGLMNQFYPYFPDG